MIRVEDLDKRICDMEDCENTQTWREYIRETEEEFELYPMNLNDIRDWALEEYIDLLDELWDK